MFSALAQETCIPHSQTGPVPVPCCPGLSPWPYDAKTGIPYGLETKACWWAPCAEAGQWAGPEGQGNSCCTGLVNVGGKCGSQGVLLPGGGTTQPAVCAGSIICDVPDLWIYGGLAAAVLLVVMM